MGIARGDKFGGEDLLRLGGVLLLDFYFGDLPRDWVDCLGVSGKRGKVKGGCDHGVSLELGVCPLNW